MPWPTDNLLKTFLDNPLDDPSQAREQLLALVNMVQAILATMPAGSNPLTVEAGLSKSGGAASRMASGVTLEFADANRRMKAFGTGDTGSFSIEAASGYVFLGAKNNPHVARNAYYDGANWQRFDTGQGAYVISIDTTGPVVMAAPAGANPITWQGPFKLRHEGNDFRGRIRSDGTAEKLPAGWSSSRPGTGQFRVTHNLGDTNYTVSGTVDASGASTGPYVVHVYQRTTTYVDFRVLSGVTPTDLLFHFTLTRD